MPPIHDINWPLWLSTMLPMALSAGPGNLMVASSGARSGVRRSLRFILGLDLTYWLLALLVGLGLYHSLAAQPQWLWSLRVAGSLYIFWRGLRLLLRSRGLSAASDAPLGFRDGVLLQLGNVQGLVMLLVMFSTFSPGTDAGSAVVLVLSAALIAVNLFGHLLWASLGSSLQVLLRDRPSLLVAQNALFGLLLMAVAMWIFLRGA
ncbi:MULTISPECIES: LysE family translocator [Pseudomonas]|uniref:LysE family translocator n=1 Tax=Pseudomonas TaxID=286 RepID=UPI0005FCD5FF|nr:MULTISPECIES: LysE family transporter [Pseudomonas]RXU60095.1 lysine transporter LysE [Pseudomonas protegens]BAQ74123.1 LysE family translocator protein [Pseudomonas sp. Os17]BAQ80422.1 LysE family translocator protein [Pseudomonas sp. St29]